MLRATRAAMTALGVVILVFALVRLVPGDPVSIILGDQASPDEQASLRHTLHVDEPFLGQFVSFCRDVGNGTLGTSFRHRDRNVSSLIADVAPPTIELALGSLLIAWLIALPLGCIAAVRRDSFWDDAARAVALIGVAFPSIWLGPLLILLFSVKFRVLPLPGDDSETLSALILPALTIGAALAAILTRQTRAAMLEVLNEQYVLAARARGLSNFKVVVKHALRNALAPVLTVGAAQLGALLGGAVVAEKLFERQGLGTLFLDAFFARDLPVVQGCVLVVAISYVTVNLVVELLYGWLDPRIRVAR